MSTTTGSVTFQEVPPGQLTIEVFYQNMMYGRTTTTMPEDDHTVTVQLIEGVKFFVFESYTANQQNRIPIADVQIEIQGPTTATLRTDQNGMAGPILLSRGLYTITYRRTGYVTRSMQVPIEQDYPSTIFEVGLDRTLAVRVINGRNNQPVQNAVVSATVGTSTISFTTDAQGNAYLNLPSGTHTVNVTPPANSGLESTSFQVTIDLDPRSQVTRQVTLTPAGIRVSVVNPRNNRNPVSGASLTLYRSGQTQSIATISTDAQGNAVFVYTDHNITTGTYEVESYRSGYRRIRRGNIQVTNINQSVSVEIEMPWTLLTVNVRDPRGQPLSGATVRVYQGNNPTPIKEGTTR